MRADLTPADTGGKRVANGHKNRLAGFYFMHRGER